MILLIIEALNIIVPLFCVLSLKRDWRNELNIQGKELVRLFVCQNNPKKYNKPIAILKKREAALNKDVEDSIFIAISLIILSLTFYLAVLLSAIFPFWLSFVSTLALFIIASWLLMVIPSLIIADEEKNERVDKIFVVSCVLSIAVIIRDWKVGISFMCLTLGKHVWVDVFQNKYSPVITIKESIKKERAAVDTAFMMLFYYLTTYLYFRFIALPYSKTLMIPWYLIMISGSASAGGGFMIASRATKKAVDEKIQSIKNREQ